MNMLYCTFSFPKLSESFILNEIVELSNRGHEISVFAHKNPQEDNIPEEISSLDLSVYYAGSPSATLSDLSTAVPALFNSDFVSRGLNSLSPLQKLRNAYIHQHFELCLQNLPRKPDLVHAHFANEDRLPLAHLSRKHDIPMCLTAHSFGLYKNPNSTALKALFDSVDQVIAPSEYNRNYILDHYDPDCDVRVIPATSRLGSFDPTDQKVSNRVLTVARMVEKKGYSYAIEAIAEVAEEVPDLEYHIIGDGYLESEIEQQIAELGLEDTVSILQQVSDSRLRKEYDEAEVFLLPCRIAESGDRDVMPVVLKEAMAMEAACLSTTVSAIPELIESGTTGVLVPPDDSVELANRLRVLLEDDEYRLQLAKAAREHVLMNYTPEVVVDDLETSLKSIVK